jgi:hypothetical protein
VSCVAWLVGSVSPGYHNESATPADQHHVSTSDASSAAAWHQPAPAPFVGLQIRLRVVIRRVQLRVAHPTTNHSDINTGRDKMDGSGMTKMSGVIRFWGPPPTPLDTGNCNYTTRQLTRRVSVYRGNVKRSDPMVTRRA